MFFTAFYLFNLAFFAYATKVVSIKKGWGEETNSDLSQLAQNPDWFFLSLWVGPPVFLIVCALPCRWNIPEEAHQESRDEMNVHITKELTARRERGKFHNWIADQKQYLWSTFTGAVFMVPFFCMPLVQFGIILHFGFDALKLIEDNILSLM